MTQPVQGAPPVRQVMPAGWPNQPGQGPRANVYLPPMPEMLRPAPAGHTQAPAGRPPAPVIRAQGADETPRANPAPAAARLILPQPEEYGLVGGGPSTPAGGADWPTARAKLDQLGATTYRLEKVPEGGFRFVCALPYPNDPTRQRQFEARAHTEQEAISAVLQRAEAWRATGK